MQKPEELIELLEMLRQEENGTTVSTGPDSQAVVYIGRTSITIPARDCILLLDTEETVESFFEAIGSPAAAKIILHDLEVEDDVKAALENKFSTVDEA